ncbi:hypothetical protein HYH03_017472 [Edaphochlamys debaryana]|uniref:Uncharacterized protein n=1 Tax=Edaphochlamys debaryana TaxID=47281 RepID=A0A836BQD8_9CHLO|nr:hypothetical protein HYH03_017472 [Edaphochlamys debaryana]|eukprot:KAG2483669.1 hypothetical protein HYH03_017472 [Edaphochlamys debaryana]
MFAHPRVADENAGAGAGLMKLRGGQAGASGLKSGLGLGSGATGKPLSGKPLALQPHSSRRAFGDLTNALKASAGAAKASGAGLVKAAPKPQNAVPAKAEPLVDAPAERLAGPGWQAAESERQRLRDAAIEKRVAAFKAAVGTRSTSHFVIYEDDDSSSSDGEGSDPARDEEAPILVQAAPGPSGATPALSFPGGALELLPDAPVSSLDLDDCWADC